MGSITRYYCHFFPDNECRIDWECEGDYGEVEDGLYLKFIMDEWIQKRFDLKEGYIAQTKMQELFPFVQYKHFLEEQRNAM